MGAVRDWAATGAVKGCSQDGVAGLLSLAIIGRKSAPLRTDYPLPGAALWTGLPYDIYINIYMRHTHMA